MLFTCLRKCIIHCPGNALENLFEHLTLWTLGLLWKNTILQYYNWRYGFTIIFVRKNSKLNTRIEHQSDGERGRGWRCRNISPRRIIKSDHLIFQKTKWNEQTAVFKSSEPPQTLLKESRIMLYCSVLPQFKSLVTLSSSFAHLKRPAKRSSSVYNNVVKVGQDCRLSWRTLALTLRKHWITSDDVAILSHPLTILCAIVLRYWKQ